MSISYCWYKTTNRSHTYIHTHTHLTAPRLGLPGWAGTRKVKPIWILLKQETVSGSGISWAICKSASRSRQITTPAPHHSVFYRPDDALPAAQPTASKHWRQSIDQSIISFTVVTWWQVERKNATTTDRTRVCIWRRCRRRRPEPSAGIRWCPAERWPTPSWGTAEARS